MTVFTREAQVLASLNHPNIAASHGVEGGMESGAPIMDLVEGPTPAERIAGFKRKERSPAEPSRALTTRSEP